jgi:hypothetical protein
VGSRVGGLRWHQPQNVLGAVDDCADDGQHGGYPGSAPAGITGGVLVDNELPGVTGVPLGAAAMAVQPAVAAIQTSSDPHQSGEGSRATR